MFEVTNKIFLYNILASPKVSYLNASSSLFHHSSLRHIVIHVEHHPSLEIPETLRDSRLGRLWFVDARRRPHSRIAEYKDMIVCYVLSSSDRWTIPFLEDLLAVVIPLTVWVSQSDKVHIRVVVSMLLVTIQRPYLFVRIQSLITKLEEVSLTRSVNI